MAGIQRQGDPAVCIGACNRGDALAARSERRADSGARSLFSEAAPRASHAGWIQLLRSGDREREPRRPAQLGRLRRSGEEQARGLLRAGLQLRRRQNTIQPKSVGEVGAMQELHPSGMGVKQTRRTQLQNLPMIKAINILEAIATTIQTDEGGIRKIHFLHIGSIRDISQAGDNDSSLNPPLIKILNTCIQAGKIIGGEQIIRVNS